MKKIKIAIIGMIMLFVLSGCSNKNIISYKDESLGFEIEMPKEWEDKYSIEKYENTVAINHIPKKDGAYPGFLFSIVRREGELITKEDTEWAYMPETFITNGNGYTFVMGMPSDIQYDPEDKEDSEEYLAMREEIEDVVKSFKISKNLKAPEARNEGYKLVGSSFFKFEIREDMYVKKAKNNPFIWDILDSKNQDIGDIELELFDNPQLEENGMSTKYFKNEELKRNIRISIKTEYEDVLSNIEETMEFLADNYISLDELYVQKEFLKSEGSEIVGRIESIDFDELQADYIFIKSDGKIKKYKAEYPTIVPMKDGNYELYGVYPFTKTFVAADLEYKEKNYKFILSKSKTVKGIIEISK